MLNWLSLKTCCNWQESIVITLSFERVKKLITGNFFQLSWRLTTEGEGNAKITRAIGINEMLSSLKNDISHHHQMKFRESKGLGKNYVVLKVKLIAIICQKSKLDQPLWHQIPDCKVVKIQLLGFCWAF